MRIGINGFEAVVPRFGFDLNGLPNRVGSSEVCFQLLVELEKIDKKNEYTIYLPSHPTSDLPKVRYGWKYEIVPNTSLWTIFALGPKVRRDKLDVFFSPTHYGPLATRCPQVISILDVSYKFFPEMFKKRDLVKLFLWGKFSIKKAAKIIAISRSAKNDIIKEYGVPEAKVEVVHLGIKESKSMNQESKEKILDKYNIKTPFILFVGTLQPRKNIIRLIEAYSKINTTNEPQYKLVIIGRKGWKYQEILEAPNKYGVEDSVKFLEEVTDEELPIFYKSAELFVLPSLYEGFGLPILEAMKYGCPVATSNVSSLPEAGGDAAIYFNPENVNEISDVLRKVIKNKDLRDDMIKKGYVQIKKFSWEKTAKEVLEALESVAKKQ